eukprot:3457333-Prymnesium_polylepis.1
MFVAHVITDGVCAVAAPCACAWRVLASPRTEVVLLTGGQRGEADHVGGHAHQVASAAAFGQHRAVGPVGGVGDEQARGVEPNRLVVRQHLHALRR